MHSLSHALDARVQWALYRVALIAENADAADGHLLDAQIGAMESGYSAYHENSGLPNLLADVPLLAAEWRRAWNETADHYANGITVWVGEWLSDMDGLRETRPSVAQAHDGFRPGLEVSHQGGDSEPRYGAPVQTLEGAVSTAEEMESRWHAADR
jgi:hypothetical protein